jgi:hypothetical protein
VTPAGFEAVAEELETLPPLPVVAAGCSAIPFIATNARSYHRAPNFFLSF